MILVSFFSEDNVLSDEIKICYIFEYLSNENERSAFLFFLFFLGGGVPGMCIGLSKTLYAYRYKARDRRQGHSGCRSTTQGST